MAIDVTKVEGKAKSDGSVDIKIKAKGVGGKLLAGQTYKVKIIVDGTDDRLADKSSPGDPEAVFTVEAGGDEHDDDHGNEHGDG